MLLLAAALLLDAQPTDNGVRTPSTSVDDLLRQEVGGSDRNFDGVISRAEAMEHDLVRARGNGHAALMDPTFRPDEAWMILPIFAALDTNGDDKVPLVDLLPAMRARILVAADRPR